MSSTTFILSGFASIPRLLTIKPKNSPAATSKAHLAGFNFIL